MAGLYVHIPFCKSRCIYCGFYSTTLLPLRQRYVDALCKEIDMYGGSWSTVYIGGGSPSVLSAGQLDQLFSHIDCSVAREVTIECNPDDVTPDFATLIGSLPVNRVSMGAQTFDGERLRFLRRRHDAREVDTAVGRLRAAGIDNISVDLIYGFPGETIEQWDSDISHAISLATEHLSAYCLSFEEGTPLMEMKRRGKVEEADEETTRQMYYHLIDRLDRAGYCHYEISNFARPGFQALHNSSYWHGVPYTGAGAAAHSYFKEGSREYRQWNVADLSAYIEAIEHEEIPMERETLSPSEQYNDMVMLALRTADGISLPLLERRFGKEAKDYCLRCAKTFLDPTPLLSLSADHLRLTRDGLYVSDMVMSALMMV